ncbi:hypothetical protein SLA2020_472230 [Shorea laevis]
MKKTFYYNFFPTKVEEEAAAAHNVQYRVTRTLIEIRDLEHHQASGVDPWRQIIRKSITASDVFMGKLSLSEQEMLDLLRPCTLSKANSLLVGDRSCILYDNTEGEVKYHIDVERGSQDSYTLRCTSLFRNRNLAPGDQVGLFLDVSNEAFRFKILGRANRSSN